MTMLILKLLVILSNFSIVFNCTNSAASCGYILPMFLNCQDVFDTCVLITQPDMSLLLHESVKEIRTTSSANAGGRLYVTSLHQIDEICQSNPHLKEHYVFIFGGDELQCSYQSKYTFELLSSLITFLFLRCQYITYI